MNSLRKEYSLNQSQPGSKSKTLAAVRNVSFKVKPGEVFGLLGPNGAGKSTILNMLTRETGPTAGSVSAVHTDCRWCTDLAVM